MTTASEVETGPQVAKLIDSLLRTTRSDYHTILESHISATEAARTFSDILNRVRYRGEAFVVERGGEPVCRISPVAG
jgi:hypothetical protein